MARGRTIERKFQPWNKGPTQCLPADLCSAALVVVDSWARPARFRSGLFFERAATNTAEFIRICGAMVWSQQNK
jgi:hypothetical protein